MYPLLCAAILVGTMYAIYNPYLAFKPKSIEEQWTTREQSYGHPYYWKMRYCPEYNVHHAAAYNRPMKQRCYPRTTMYLE